MAVPYFGNAIIDSVVSDSDLLLQESEFLTSDGSSSLVPRASNIDAPGGPSSKELCNSCQPSVADKLMLNIHKIIITAVVFFAILTWFEFLRTLYDAIFAIGINDHHPGIVAKRLAYAVFITAIAIIIVYIVYRIMLY